MGYEGEKRNSFRYPFEFEVTILTDDKQVFRCKTLNVSNYGILLDKILPEEIAHQELEVIIQPTQIYYSRQASMMLFRARVIVDDELPCRLNFVSSPANSFAEIERIINAG